MNDAAKLKLKRILGSCLQVGGTVLAGKLAKEKGWAINVGGGFHHCCGYRGGGFCVYADITLCIQFAISQLSVSKYFSHLGDHHQLSFTLSTDAKKLLFFASHGSSLLSAITTFQRCLNCL
jgi:hypothetical protein